MEYRVRNVRVALHSGLLRIPIRIGVIRCVLRGSAGKRGKPKRFIEHLLFGVGLSGLADVQRSTVTLLEARGNASLVVEGGAQRAPAV